MDLKEVKFHRTHFTRNAHGLFVVLPKAVRNVRLTGEMTVSNVDMLLPEEAIPSIKNMYMAEADGVDLSDTFVFFPSESIGEDEALYWFPPEYSIDRIAQPFAGDKVRRTISGGVRDYIIVYVSDTEAYVMPGAKSG